MSWPSLRETEWPLGSHLAPVHAVLYSRGILELFSFKKAGVTDSLWTSASPSAKRGWECCTHTIVKNVQWYTWASFWPCGYCKIMNACVNLGQLLFLFDFVVRGRWGKKKNRVLWEVHYNMWLLCCISIIVTNPVPHMAPGKVTSAKHGDCWISLSLYIFSCQWPSSYKEPEGGRFWGSVSWWLLKLLLQIQGQQSSRVYWDIMPGSKEFIDLKKACCGIAPVRFTYESQSREATFISSWEKRFIRWNFIPPAGMCCVVPLESHLRDAIFCWKEWIVLLEEGIWPSVCIWNKCT